MKLTNQQEHAIKMINKWLHDYYYGGEKKKIFVLNGYAGTGKTSILKYIDDKYLKSCVCAAYTGKAAKVLKNKTNLSTSTIHSLIYTPIEDSSNKKGVRWVINKESLICSAKVVIIDESSMVGKSILKDLMSYEVPILLIGDPGQLEVINDTNIFNSLKPDITLTEIHRQAKDNPIIRLSMRAREGKDIPFQSFSSNVKKVPKNKDTISKYLYSSGIALVGRNNTRRLVNNLVRAKLKKHSTYPSIDDRIICLQNNLDLGVLNGYEGIVTSSASLSTDITNTIVLSGYLDDTILKNTTALSCYFESNAPEEIMATFNRKFLYSHLHIDYAYAITVHKSQGSQYENVCIIDEFNYGGEDNRRRLLYTAITRAEKGLIILK